MAKVSRLEVQGFSGGWDGLGGVFWDSGLPVVGVAFGVGEGDDEEGVDVDPVDHMVLKAFEVGPAKFLINEVMACWRLAGSVRLVCRRR